MQSIKTPKNTHLIGNQKNSFPHIVDKVVNKLEPSLYVVYNLIFESIVFYLKTNMCEI